MRKLYAKIDPFFYPSHDVSDTLLPAIIHTLLKEKYEKIYLINYKRSLYKQHERETANEERQYERSVTTIKAFYQARYL